MSRRDAVEKTSEKGKEKRTRSQGSHVADRQKVKNINLISRKVSFKATILFMSKSETDVFGLCQTVAVTDIRVHLCNHSAELVRGDYHFYPEQGVPVLVLYELE